MFRGFTGLTAIGVSFCDRTSPEGVLCDASTTITPMLPAVGPAAPALPVVMPERTVATAAPVTTTNNLERLTRHLPTTSAGHDLRSDFTPSSGSGQGLAYDG